MTLRSKPVAVTTMSASIVVPFFVTTPVGVNVSMTSVTIEAFPEAIPRKRSPSGMNARRCCHGL